MADRVLAFYREIGTDDAGRSLANILEMSDDQLEHVHDHIQWLFPLREPSMCVASAPILSSRAIDAFRSEPALRENLCRSCRRMLSFYGMACTGPPQSPTEIRCDADFTDHSRHWLVPGNHNHLRLTRMLKSLRILGLRGCSHELLRRLEAIAKEMPGRISETTLRFWRESQH